LRAGSQLVSISVDSPWTGIHTLRIVKGCTGFALILAAIVAAGCGGSPGASSGNSPDAPNLTGNWQILPSVVSDTIPPQAVLLLGALHSSASQVSGTFRFTNLAQPSTCGLDQVVTLSGSVDSSNKLTLTSATLPNGTTIKVSLGITGASPYSGTGTIEVDGATCAFPPTAALGQEIANTSGTFAGALTQGILGSPTTGTAGTGNLTLTQSTSPDSDGQFAATGTLSYQFGSCSGNATLSGTVNGDLVSLSASSGTISNPQFVSFHGLSDNVATRMAASLFFFPAPCSTDLSTNNATYSGTLVRQ
jgi:hypothetical protein